MQEEENEAIARAFTATQGHQFEVLELIRMLNQEQGLTVVMVLHDLNHAAAFSDRLTVISQGQIVGDGTPHDVLNPQLLRDVFGVDATIVDDPATGRPVVLPHRSAKRAGTSEQETR